jgi:hypothetical protein
LSWISLRWSLAVGAGYDAIFAALMLLAPEWLQQTFGLPLPGEAFYLWLIAVLLLMLSAMYALACRDPLRYGGVIDVAIVGRALGAVAFGVAATRSPALAGGLWPCAIGDAAFALWHFLSWRPHRVGY